MTSKVLEGLPEFLESLAQNDYMIDSGYLADGVELLRYAKLVREVQSKEGER